MIKNHPLVGIKNVNNNKQINKKAYCLSIAGLHMKALYFIVKLEIVNKPNYKPVEILFWGYLRTVREK